METENQCTLSAKTSFSNSELFDRIQGCIYGAALGDAFGLSTEFMTKVSARHLYGVGPIKFGKDKEGYEFWRDGHRSRWNENDFTDDTDQLLLILQCVLRNEGILDPREFAYRLREWTQSGFPELCKPPCGIGFTVGSVINHPDFISAPHKAAYDVWNRNKRDLAANGAVMRTSVLGIPFFWNEPQVVKNTIEAAKVTHADPRTVISAIIVSVIVSRILSGDVRKRKLSAVNNMGELNEYILKGTDFDTKLDHPDSPIFEPKSSKQSKIHDTAKSSGIFGKIVNYFGKRGKNKGDPHFEFPEFKTLDRKRGETAAELPEILPKSIDTFEADTEMEELCHQVMEDYKFLLESSPFYEANGNPTWVQDLEAHCFPKSVSDLKLDDKKSMGYTFKCLGAGIYCLTRAKGQKMSDAEFFKAVITQLTLEGGDADTNCAVAGALLGSRLGKSGLPIDWLNGLRNAQFLEEISKKLCSLITK